MCCEDELEPPPIKDMLDRYRTMLAERGYDWGNENQHRFGIWSSFFGACNREQLTAEFRKVIDAGDVPLTELTAARMVLNCLKDPLPAGYVVARPEGIDIAEQLPFIFGNRAISYQIINMDETDTEARVCTVTRDATQQTINGRTIELAEVVPHGRVWLHSDGVSRWSVTDERGGAWFPDDALHKFDSSGVPYFHGNNIAVEVPIGTTHIRLSRGCEFRSCTTTVQISPGDNTVVNLNPERVYDAASYGWYGADLHVHMNYSGDQVCAPKDVARMQVGEGLHLMNLVAANASTALIYDQEAFEHFIGKDLPWSTNDVVARWGVEYRNDLLGHFTALSPSDPPTRYQTGHLRSHEPQDWPPNATAIAEFRDLGATIGYTHPVMGTIGDDGSPARIFTEHRAHAPSARELVADAALGLVDSMDLTPPSDIRSAVYLYHRLLSCGLRLAATAGTDVFLSYKNANPPGMFRAYADLKGAPLSVAAWQNALRAKRTFVTNGPWLELDVAGSGLGETLVYSRHCSVPVRATVTGLGVESLEIVGPDGVLAETGFAFQQERATLTTELDVTEPLWLVAVARGTHDPVAGGGQHGVFAHTSPVWIEVDGRSIARPADAEWCLDWLDRFENLARRVGNFSSPDQLDDLIEVLTNARVYYSRIVTDTSESESHST